MCIATKLQPIARVQRARPRRRPASLELVIDGTRYEVGAFEDVEAAVSVAGWKHVLRGPTGRKFAVYDPGLSPAEMRAIVLDPDAHFPRISFHCEACLARDCVHIDALHEVGLL
jgi:hypothetical protein